MSLRYIFVSYDKLLRQTALLIGRWEQKLYLFSPICSDVARGGGHGGKLPPGAALGGRKIHFWAEKIDILTEKMLFWPKNRCFVPENQGGWGGKGGRQNHFLRILPPGARYPSYVTAYMARSNKKGTINDVFIFPTITRGVLAQLKFSFLFCSLSASLIVEL